MRTIKISCAPFPDHEVCYRFDSDFASGAVRDLVDFNWDSASAGIRYAFVWDPAGFAWIFRFTGFRRLATDLFYA